MLVVLQVVSNGARTRRVQLRANQVLRVGRSDWADFTVDDDFDMADVQFELRSTDDGCDIHSLSANTPTLVNGTAIETAPVHHGDRIKAGHTEFVIHIEGERTIAPLPDPPAPAKPAATTVASDTRPAMVSLVATCAYLEFHDEISARAATTPSADELIAELAEQEKFLDALRLRAFLMTKREAVWWGCLCVRDELDAPLNPPQSAAVKAASIWVGEPSEVHRRAAEQQAAAAKYSGFGATLALSAFWSGGSLAPPENPEVLPDERLTSQGVAAALISAAYSGEAAKAKPRIHAFLSKGKEISDGKIPLPEGNASW